MPVDILGVYGFSLMVSDGFVQNGCIIFLFLCLAAAGCLLSKEVANHTLGLD